MSEKVKELILAWEDCEARRDDFARAQTRLRSAQGKYLDNHKSRTTEQSQTIELATFANGRTYAITVGIDMDGIHEITGIQKVKTIHQI